LTGKRANSHDVAKLAGVSRTTVSFILNGVAGVQIPEETRRRVWEAARQLNYYPDAAARSLASGKSRVIGLILCQQADHLAADLFLPEVLRGITDNAREWDFRVLLETVANVSAPDAYLSLARERQIDGIVISGPRSDDQQLGQLVAEGFPVVLQGRLRGADIPFVDVDNVAGAKQAVAHLIGLGHQRIGLITNAPLHYTASEDRYRGYRQALSDAGLAYDEALMRQGDFVEESGYLAMRELLGLPNRPSAVFVASDVVAFGALAAIREQGLRIPQDMAVVGFDDIRLAPYMHPPLTTVHLPAYELGWQAGDLLLHLIRGETPMRTEVLLPTELVVRQSCGARTRQRD
jgi:LacI family transcriptional regulator